MGNTSSERAGMGQEKAHRRDSRGTKDGDRPKILMDSPEDADIFHGEDIKVCAGSHYLFAYEDITIYDHVFYLYFSNRHH